VDGNVRQLAQSRHEAVASIVDGALKAQPSLNVVDVTAALLKQFATHDCAGVTYVGDFTRKAMDERAPSKVDLEVSRESIPIAIIDAPFPEAAMGGDAYDAIDATQCLPEFDRLPAEFGKKHSVIRTGDKTVVMNAAHYADLLQARDIAIKARQDSEIYQQAAAAAVQSLSDIETILCKSRESAFMLLVSRDGTFSACGDGIHHESTTVRALLSEFSGLILAQPKVTDETTYQSGVEEVSFRVEPASCDEKCQTEPVDSAGQTGATQDTTEKTSNQF
jgi:hypothetical protein